MHSWTPFVVINVFLFPTCGLEELWEIQTICSRQEHEILIFQLLKQLYIHSLSLSLSYLDIFGALLIGQLKDWTGNGGERGGDNTASVHGAPVLTTELPGRPHTLYFNPTGTELPCRLLLVEIFPL